jgi:hypothetical protein
MFLRKLFSLKNKFTWVLIDLLIVIIGVYCAFLIQNYAANQKTAKEKDRVLTALKYEMEYIRYRMYETSLGMKQQSIQLKEILERNTYNTIFSNFRFIEPQYDYQTIEYALDLQNTEIVDFMLYDQLQSLFVEIKKIEHVERLLAETSRRYRSIPESLNRDSEAFTLLFSENMDNFRRFVTLINDRAEISGRIAMASSEAMPIINTRLGTRKAREIEREIIIGNLDLVSDEEEAV